MAQDAPADTAGPSSPPPRLPDGWLPQWEGVQRQWYYVQRATGKSQWDIPTEPVVLTPSTTPTSIGTGPSQAPSSRPSTNSPCVTATGNSLVERMESAADKARFSSSLSSQLDDRPSTSMQGSPGTLGWHSVHNVQHGSQYYTQPVPSGSRGYAAGQIHQTMPGNPDHRPIYANQGHHQMQAHQQPTWGSHAPMTQMLPSGPTANPITEQYRSFPIDGQQTSQIPAYAASIAYPGNQSSGLVQPVFSPSQPAWQLRGHETKSSHLPQPSSDHYNLSSLPDPFYGSQPMPQTSGQHPGESASRSSQPSIPYHQGSAHGGAQHYQNPIVQAAVQHYLPQQPQSSTQSDVNNQHRANYHPHSSQSTIHQGQWTTSASASRIAASDPQFVSGPWASSTPPTSGPPQQPHYG